MGLGAGLRVVAQQVAVVMVQLPEAVVAQQAAGVMPIERRALGVMTAGEQEMGMDVARVILAGVVVVGVKAAAKAPRPVAGLASSVAAIVLQTAKAVVVEIVVVVVVAQVVVVVVVVQVMVTMQVVAPVAVLLAAALMFAMVLAAVVA